MSNRADFLDIREQEAFENPLEYERPEEKNPEVSALERRANAYLAGIERNRLRNSIKHAINHPDAILSKPTDHSGIDFDAKFIGPKPMTDLERSRFIPEASEETKRNNIKSVEDGFKRLRKKS